MATIKTTTQIHDIATPPPYINKDTGTWWVHNGQDYVDSGTKAVGKDGHSFTASLRIKGYLRNGVLGNYYVYPTFLYDGNDVTNIIQENFVTRFNENTGKGWSNWDQRAGSDGLDLADTGYEGPGVDIEVKATYKGLTAVAHAFVPHIRDGEKGDTGTSTIYFGDRKWGSSIFNAYTKMGFSTTWINNLSLPAPKVGDTIWLSITNIETGKSGQLYLLVTQSSTTPTATVISLVMDGKDGAKGAKGDKGDGLDVKDTRNDNQPPKWYRENYKMTTVKEFKLQSAIGIPTGWRDGYYCTLETTSNWSNSSGGPVQQKVTLQNSTVLIRQGTKDDSAWEPWSNPEEELRQDLSNANTAIDALKKATKMVEESMITDNDIKWLLDAYNEGKTTVAGGLVLTKIIALSNQVDRITAYLSGYDGNNGDGKILRAGIKYDAKERREKVGTEHVKVPLVDALEEYWNTDAQIDGFAEVYREKYPTGPNFEALRSQNKAGLDQWLSEGFPNGMAMNNEMLKEIGKKPDFSMDLTAALVKDMYVEYTADVYTVIPGEDLGTEHVAIRHDGTGHFGEVYFGGDRIDYKESDDSTPYLSIGRMRVKRIESVIDGNDVDTTQTLTMKQLKLYSNIRTGITEDTKTIYVTNDNTAVTFSLDNMALNSGNPPNVPERNIEGAEMYFAAELFVDNTVICRLSGEWRAKYVGSQGDGDNGMRWVYGQNDTMGSQQLSSGDLSVTHVLNSGSHTVKFRVIKTFELLKYGYDVNASLSGCTVHQVYNSNYKQAIITPQGARFYAGADKYLDFDYNSSGYAFKFAGGMLVDRLKLQGGGFYAGGVIDTYGVMQRWVGKKLEIRKASTGRYRITHSIGHMNYVVNAMPINDTDWNAFVIRGTETTSSVEIGVQWNGGWRDGPLHFTIFAQ